MLKIELNGKSIVNPNEEIKNQFRQIIHENEQYSDEQIYDIIYDTIENIKNVNYLEYISIITLMYKDTYCYYNYLLKSNETNLDILEDLSILDACSIEDVLNAYYDNQDFFLQNFVYVLNLNNLFYIKMMLSLNDFQNKLLNEIIPLNIYDEMALKQYTNFTSLEDYYFSIIDENMVVEEVVEHISNFLEYLYYYNKETYDNYIKSIIQKIYKYCYYYLNNSTEIEEEDLEVRVIKLINDKNAQEIGEELQKNQNMLNEILLRIFDDLELGYPSISTNNGYKLVTDKEINDYIIKIKQKH